MILDISRTIFRWYVSIVKYFCPSQIIGDNDIIANSPLLSEYNVKTDETYDMYVDEIDDTYVYEKEDKVGEKYNEKYNEKYKINYEQFLQGSHRKQLPIKKSYSNPISLHYCGWCFGSIDSPSHFYMDRVYCNHNCRNYQIIKDDRMFIKKRHTAASFSN